MSNTVFKVEVFDLNLNRLSSKVFAILTQANQYAQQLRSEHNSRIGKVTVTHVKEV